MEAPDTDPTCPGEPDADCSHAYGTVGDGIGRGLVINANLIMGNAAEAGGGGGIRFQGVNGIEVSTFPSNPERWYSVNVTNNIITNNVAGWDGGGVSLQDSIGVNLINNTIISNDSTASSGTLFGAFFAPQASAPTPCPRDAQGANIPCVPLSDPQPAGLSSAGHSAEFLASLPASITCPPGHPLNTTSPSSGVVNGACRAVSFPALYNDAFWQNRAFNIVVTEPSAQPTPGAQQSVVTLVPQLNQSTTGQCVTPPAGTTYWDIGLRGDHGPTDHSSGYTFQPKASVLTDITGYPGGPTGFRVNTASFSPGVVKQYCNGSKVPPEAGAGAWYQVPPGTNEGNVPVPIFNLTPGATVDEGNNWISISWGPLSLITPTTETNPSTETMIGNYSLAAGSPAINYITATNSSATYSVAPSTDFFGNPRPSGAGVDVGAVEVQITVPLPTLTSIAPTSGLRGTSVPVTFTGTNLTGATGITISGDGITITGMTVVSSTTVTATFAIPVFAAPTARSVTITTPSGTSNAVTFTVIAPPAPTLTSITPSSGARGTSFPVTLIGTNFTPTGNTIGVTGTLISVGGVTVISSTQINLTFSIGAGAALGARTVTVTNAGGTSNGVTFTVFVQPTPTLTSITPTSGARGTNFPVTLIGANFTPTGNTITVSVGGVSASAITVISSTQINATLTIVPGAALTARTVTVTNAGGTSNSVTFTVVNPPAPTLASIAPTSGARGTSVSVTLTGTNFTPAGTVIAVTGGGITISGVTVVNSTTVTATFAISTTAAATARSVRVSNPGGTSSPVTFTVN